jgi:DNA-binding NarL/FixJ family response regulator
VLRGFESRLAAATEQARRALAVVAADDVGDAAVITAALARLGEPADGLDAAEACGLLVREGTRVRLAHPLLRAVAYHQVAAASRRAAHRALAAALDRPDQAAARAWQLAAAAEGPDETAAAALALVAEDAQRRGGPASAARTLEHAAALTPDPARAQRRLAEAALLWLGSDPARALATGERIASPVDADVAAALTEIGIAAYEPVPKGFEREFTALRAEHALRHGDDTTAESAARAAIDGLDEGDAARLARAVLVRLGIDNGAGPLTAPGLGMFARRAWNVAADARVAAGFVDGDRVPAGTDVASALRAARIDLLQGRAQVAADRLRGRVELQGGDDAALIRAEAELLLGRRDRATTGLDAVLDRAEHAGLTRRIAHAAWITGRATNDTAALERAAHLAPARFGADAVAALVAAGRREPAQQLARNLERYEHAGPLFRARALRAQATAAIEPAAFDAALAVCDEHGLVVEAIECLRASGALDDARARARMTDLRLFEESAAVAASNTPRLRDKLSAAELRVAEVVASGLTNRQAAEELFLSVKTVDFHLQQIYRKLEVRTRTQLAVLVSRDAGGMG